MNREQQNVFDTVTVGKNIFITGSAGTGKSYTVNAIVEWAKSVNKQIGITSSTGVSAVNIKGRTIHSFLGIGLARQSAYNLYAKNRKNTMLSKKIKALNILIIDEISMISAELFDKISEYIGLMRKINEPFGGLQMILCGDMCQLPPVGGEYCFKSATWSSMNLEIHALKTIIRQEHDDVFKRILEDARFGIVTDESLAILKSRKHMNFGEIKPTILYSKNVNVEMINEREYQKLLTTGVEERVYKTTYSPDTAEMRDWGKLNNIPEEVRLCVGAQVMITANIAVDAGFANGTRCMVTEFTRQGEPVVVTKTGEQIIIEPFPFAMDDEKEDHVVSSIPLKLAYALTVHKSQSCTLDAAVINLGRDIFEYGQAYTALSRIRDLNSVMITEIYRESFKVSPEIIEFFKNTSM